MHTGVGRQGLKMIIDIVKTTDIPIQHFRPTHMRKILEDDVVEFTRLGGYADYTSSEEPDPKSQEILEVLEQRRKTWQPKPARYQSGVLKIYSEHAVGPMKGGYMK